MLEYDKVGTCGSMHRNFPIIYNGDKELGDFTAITHYEGCNKLKLHILSDAIREEGINISQNWSRKVLIAET